MASITINPLPGFRQTDPITIDVVNLVKAATGVEISGSVTGIENGRPVTISLLDRFGLPAETLSTLVSNGTWAATLSPVQASTFANGFYTISAVTSSAANDPASAILPLLVDTTPPTITAITQDDPATAGLSHVHYTVTFSEPVMVPDAASNFLSIETTGTLAGVRVAGVAEVPGSNGTQYSVDVATGTGEGTITLHVLGQTGLLNGAVTDFAGNGVGPGTIQTTYIATTQPGHDFVAVADLNQDGRADLVLANNGTLAAPGNTVSVLLGRGDGTFLPNQDYVVGSAPDSVVIADVNLDGRPDIVAANRASDTVSVLLGNGDGTFQAQHAYATGGMGRFKTTFHQLDVDLFGFENNRLSIAIGDVNGDSRPDIVTADAGSTTSVLLGNGDGTFRLAHAYAGGTDGGSPSELVLVDVNRDGRLDLITGHGGGFSIALGNGDGSFQPPPLGIGFSVASLASADLNRDGNPDLIVSDFPVVFGDDADSLVIRHLQVLLGTGTGTFTPAGDYHIGHVNLPSDGPVSIAIADIDGDHNLDIVTANNTAPSVDILFGNGDGTFRVQPNVQFPGIIPDVRSVAVGDVDGDGRPDIVADLPGTPLLATLLNRPTQQVAPTYTIDRNDAPIALASDIATEEDTRRSFTADDFKFADPNDQPGDQLAGVVIASLPSHGSLSLDGNPVDVNDRVAADQVGHLVYTPANNFSGSDGFAFQVQDDGGTEGGGHDTSTNAATMTIAVAAVNDAPVVTVEAESTIVQAGGQISFSQDNRNAIKVADVDAERSAETVTLSAEHGSVRLASGSGVVITDGADNSAIVAFSGTISQLNAALNGLTYAPDAAFAGEDTLTITIDDEGHNGLGGAQKGSITMVTSVLNNHAPLLNPAAFVTVGHVFEDTPLQPGAGAAVSDLVGSFNVTDAEGFWPGIAVIGADTAHGTWFYNLQGSDVWQPLGPVSEQSALLLSGPGRIAFVPAADFNGTITDGITFRAWDGSDGLASGTTGVDASVNGGATAFSIATDTVTAFVDPVNDAPTISLQGRVDLVTANQVDGSVSLLTANGVGGFAVHPAQPLGFVPADIATGDLNHDGTLDLVVANADSSSISVLLGDGLGGFRAAGQALGLSSPAAVALRDFDGDGNLDLVVTGNSNQIRILFGNGAGGFGTTLTGQVGPSPVAMATGDFDHDGHPEIAVASTSANDVWIADPDHIGASVRVATFSAQPTSLAAADLSRDGTLDIAATTAHTVEVLTPHVGGAATHSVVNVGADLSAIAVGDVNADGKLDVVVADAGADAALVLLGDGQGGLTLSQTLQVGAVPVAISLLDVEGDGDLDIVTTNAAGNSISVLSGFGNGTFTNAVSTMVGGGPGALATGNFDNAEVVNEDTRLQFAPLFHNAITLGDVDANGGHETLTLSVQHGTVTPQIGLATVTAGAFGSATVTLNGTVAALNSALNFLSYNPTPEFSGTDTLIITLSDNGNSGSGGPLTTTQHVPIIVTAVNDPPSITLENSDPVLLRPGQDVSFSATSHNAITVADVDSFGLADTVTLSATHGTVRIAAGPGSGVTLIQGSNNSAGFTFAGDLAHLNAALSSLTYRPDAGFMGDDTLNITINDGGHGGAPGPLTASAAIAITVDQNDAPVLDPAATPVWSVAEDAVPTVAGGLPVSTLVDLQRDGEGGLDNVIDPDGPGLGIAVTAVDSSHGSWLYTTDNGANWSEVDDQTLAGHMLLLSTDSSTRLFFQPAADFSGVASEAITFRAWDMSDGNTSGALVAAVTTPDSTGAFSNATDTLDVFVTEVNDSPVIHVENAAPNLPENQGSVFSAGNHNALMVSDVDAGDGIETVTLSVQHGSVAVAPGLEPIVTGGANGSATITFSGTLEQLNDALDGLSYTPAADFTGFDTLSITVDDQGHNGTGGAMTATQLVPISVVVANHAPAIDIPSPDSAVIGINSLLSLSTRLGGPITVSDVDANGATETVSLSAGHGAVELLSLNGVTITNGANSSSSMTFTGTVTQLNQALATLAYLPENGFAGGDTVNITINDDGHSGAGGPLSASASVAIAVLPWNEDPTVHLDATDVTTAEVHRLFFTAANHNAITVADADAQGPETLMLSVDHGRVILPAGADITVTGGADASNTVTISGTIDRLNAALDGLAYAPDFAFNGADTLTIDITDGARPELGGPGEGTAVLPISVTAVNDAPFVDIENLDPQAVERGGAFAFVQDSGNGISISDDDGNDSIETVTLSVAHGTLILAANSGVTINAGADGSGGVTFSGTVDQVNAALDGLVYAADEYFNGEVDLNIEVNDGTDSGTGTVSIKAGNDAPILDPSRQLVIGVNEDDQLQTSSSTLVSSLVHLAGAGALGNVSDPDGPGLGIAITAVDGSQGTWFYSTDDGAHWASVDPDLASHGQLVLLAADTQTRLFFQPDPDFNGTVADALTFRAWDMSDGRTSGSIVAADGPADANSVSSAIDTVNVTVAGVNDAPTISAPSSIAVPKQVETPLTGIVFSDDAGSAPVHVALSEAAGGRLLASSGDGVTVGGTSSSLTLDGTIDDINAFIAASHLTYISPLQGITSLPLSITIDDEGNAGLGPRSPASLTAMSVLDIAIDAVNFAPILTDDGSSAATLEQQPVRLDPSMTVFDKELDVFGYAGASLTVARHDGASAEDSFDFDTTGAAFSVDGSRLKADGMTFGSFTAVGGMLAISFTGEEAVATTALVNDVMQHITYLNQSDTPPADVTIDYVFSDGNGGFQGADPSPGLATHSTVVHITPIDDAPTLNAGPLSVNEFAAPEMVAGIVSLQEPEGNLTAGRQAASQITYSLVDDAGGRFTIDDAGEIHVANGLLLDYEQAASHDVTVRAVEAGNAPVDKTFTVTVNNVDPETIVGDGNANTFFGGALDDNLNGAGGNDWLQGRGGNNTLTGGDGTDTVDYSVSPAGIYLDFASDHTYRNGFGGMDTVSGFEQVLGSSHDDIVRSGPGDHRIDGGAGIDAVDYAAAPGAVTANLATGTATNGFGGTDTLMNVEDVLGSSFNDTLIGDAHDNELFGYFGADVMKGGLGNDIYTVDNPGDQVIEDANAGRDAVHAMISYALPDNVENLLLDGAVSGVGNALDNTIVGDAGNNLIDGGAGVDVLIGGAGNDVYFVDDFRDIIMEMPGEGNDTVVASTSYALSDNVEALSLTGSGDSSGTGNGSANTIFGNAGNNAIDGGLGADVMAGGLGDDTYQVDNAGDRVVEQPGSGHDVVFASVSYLIENDIEDLHLVGTAGTGVGNAAANVIVGNEGDNTIDGRGGADVMIGGLGNDSYFVDDIRDQVVEAAGQGTDTVYAGISAGLADNVENMNLTGTDNINGVGNSLDNAIRGNAGNNALDGGAGADTLTGGAGNDYFIFGAGQANGDVVTDFQGNGGTGGKGDVLVFSGYGPGATFTQDDATHWEVNGNGHHDVITFSNAPTIHAGDWVFV